MWAGVVAMVVVGFAALVFLGTFVFFAVKDPDLLRSESYSIQKLAIQKGIVGDDTGYITEAEEVRPQIAVRSARAAEAVEVEAGPGGADA
jgi:hypothetical protein